MAKEVKGYVKLTIVAAKANPAPPVGPALGQQGLNIRTSVNNLTMLQVLWNQAHLFLL